MAERTNLSKLEYLKKYMSAPKNEELMKKKEKLRPIVKAKNGIRIIDDDIDMKKIKPGYEVDDDHLETQEDAPQVAAIIDERSDELRTKQDFVESSKWKRFPSGDSEPTKTRTHHDPDSDRSPPRNLSPSATKGTSKKIKEEPDSDASPPRRRIKEEPDASPPRRKRPVDSDGDLSPVRTKAKTTLSGKVAGLQTGRALRQEAEVLRKKEDEAFGRLDRELTGENARTQVRAAKLADMEAKVALNRQKQEKLQMLKEATDKWSKGVKQDRDRAERVAEAAHEMAKPLARFAGDDDLEQHLRAVERDGDPMAQFLAKKKAKTQPSRPVYRGPAAAPNRFGILPGYRWDGVDRSNGYEKKYFEKHNKTLAVSEEAYKWSVSDM